MANTALVIVDVQRDFLDPTMAPRVGSWEKAFCVPGIHRLISHAHTKAWPVIHVGTRHQSTDTLPLHQQRREVGTYCIGGSLGCEFVVRPQGDEPVLYKRWYSAFESELREHLADCAEVVWAGVATDCCIQQSAFDADRFGIRSIIPIQAVSASSCEAFTASLTALSKSAADVVELNELLGGAETVLEPASIEQAASGWYRDQQSRIADATYGGLDSVLDRLRDPPSSA